MGRQGAVVHDGTPDTVEADLSVMPRRVRTSLLRQLAEGERIVIRTRQHPMVLWRQTVWPLVAAWVWWWLVFRVQATPRFIDVATVVLLVGLARLGWMELERRYRWFVATNKRILKHEGFLDLSVPMMRLTKVTDMTYRRSLAGELLGFGTIIIESAGQQQAIRDLTYVPEPDQVSAALNSEIFGEKPRRRDEHGGRGWPRISPRRRRRDEDDDGWDDGGPGDDLGPPPSDPGSGGVDVSPAGHPPTVRPETWYRSSNLGAPRRLGDTGEIPVVRAGDEDPGRDDEGGPDGGGRVREIPLYPPRDWVDRR
ncbi:PH domain-containing protein [Phycicoccus duodecadis]|uniref:PH (Pleckstrin Homology) domain-containing protein n=1 Tax=Phycicoccus duodecadis TaxID=173053 RepID=A0A2N3YLA6_9MICO|nr:PH domain-containing protein [Phycicoccus duodecadis]PKW27640.1 PH (Pleckstrin Homology) domain-containing protein [Phycicoccus duodecadis]